MTSFERRQVEEILEFLKDKKDINSYDIKGDVIHLTTNEEDEEDMEFLKFRITSAIELINEKLENMVDIEIVGK